MKSGMQSALNATRHARVWAITPHRLGDITQPPRTSRDELVQRILATVDSIPKGSVASYGQVAREAGLPRHARLVGRVLRELSSGSKLAWHRVVNSAGKISARADGAPSVEQRRRLEREGVRFEPSGRIDLARFGWVGSSSP